MTSTDPRKFEDTKPYASRIKEARKKLGVNDAVITAEGQLNGRPVVVCAMEFAFIGGSMGAVVGEKVTRGVELAMDTRQPLIVVSCSGGARMMEGDRKSTRLNSSHLGISYAVFCLKKKKYNVTEIV